MKTPESLVTQDEFMAAGLLPLLYVLDRTQWTWTCYVHDATHTVFVTLERYTTSKTAPLHLQFAPIIATIEGRYRRLICTAHDGGGGGGYQEVTFLKQDL